MALGFFTDAGLTTPLSALGMADTLDGSLPHPVGQVFLGDTNAAVYFQPQSSGLNPIVLSVVDLAVDGNELPTAIKLALTEGGLATAVAGAALTLKLGGTPLLGGVANAVPVWIVFDDQTGVVSPSTKYKNLVLRVNPLVEIGL